MGVTPDKVFAFLKVGGEEDITIEHLSTLFGITTALKEGDTTPEQAFATEGSTTASPAPTAPAAKKALPTCSDEIFEAKKSGWKATVEKGIKSVNDLIAFIQTKELLTDDQKMEIAGWSINSGDAS